jgi:hypothetical protein
MGFHEGAADPKPHPHSMRFSGIERLKETFQCFRFDAAAQILHRDPHRRLAAQLVALAPQSFTMRRSSSTPLIASIPFITRFSNTCWSWTRSPDTRGRSSGSPVRTSMRCSANYWGDNSVGSFAPECSYSSSGVTGGQVRVQAGGEEPAPCR